MMKKQSEMHGRYSSQISRLKEINNPNNEEILKSIKKLHESLDELSALYEIEFNLTRQVFQLELEIFSHIPLA